jgi:hypothetical protein
MSRYVGRDVRDKIISLLSSGGTSSNVYGYHGTTVNSLATELGLIDTERGETTPTPGIITYKWDEAQYPTVVVDYIKKDNLNTGEGMNSINNALSELGQLLELAIFIEMQSHEEAFHNYLENYVDATERILQVYMDINITWIIVDNVEMTGVYKERNGQGYMKMAKIGLQVRVN